MCVCVHALRTRQSNPPPAPKLSRAAQPARALSLSLTIAKPWSIAAFAARTARGPREAISPAIDSASFSAPPAATSLFAIPSSWASAAPSLRAVKMSSLALDAPFFRHGGFPVPVTIVFRAETEHSTFVRPQAGGGAVTQMDTLFNFYLSSPPQTAAVSCVGRRGYAKSQFTYRSNGALFADRTVVRCSTAPIPLPIQSQKHLRERTECVLSLRRCSPSVMVCPAWKFRFPHPASCRLGGSALAALIPPTHKPPAALGPTGRRDRNPLNKKIVTKKKCGDVPSLMFCSDFLSNSLSSASCRSCLTYQPRQALRPPGPRDDPQARFR